MKFTRHLISNSNLGVTVVVLHIKLVLSSPSFPAPFSTWNALVLTRPPKGVAVHKYGFEAKISDQCVEANPRYPLGYPPPIISTLLAALNRRSLGPSLPPTNNLKGCDTVADQRLQIQFKFDPTKHFRATENPIRMPEFLHQ